jgi:hypothetical protein
MAAAVAISLVAGSGRAHADLEVIEYDGTTIEGGFNVVGNQAHWWNASSGYHILDTTTGVVTDVGTPDSYNTNFGGDPFGVYDAVNDRFYAATFASGSETFLYSYDHGSSTWSDAGQAVNMYGGAVSQGNLYISGLREPWSGGFDTNYISLYDFSGNNQHDALIETGGASAHVAVSGTGDVYYATYGDWGEYGRLYKWDAASVQDAFDGFAGGEEDTFLTLEDGEILSTLPGGGNGIAVDDSGAVFFTINNFTDPSLSGVLRWDASMGTGETDNYQMVLDKAGAGMDPNAFAWFGPVAIDGTFDQGDTLYTSLNFNGPITGITVPEPASLAMLALGGVAMLRRRQSQS